MSLMKETGKVSQRPTPNPWTTKTKILICFPMENIAARLSVHIIIFFFFSPFLVYFKHVIQHFHHMTFDQMDIPCCNQEKYVYFSQKTLIAIDAFVIRWGSCEQRS